MKRKGILFSVITLLALIAISGCTLVNKKFVVSTSVTNWGDEQSILTDFGQKNHLNMKVQNGSETKRLKTIKGTDVVELSQINAVRGNSEGLFKKLDFKKLHNFKYLSESQQQLARTTNSIPYTMQSVELAYDPDVVDDISFTVDLWNRDLVKSLAIPNLSSSLGPAMIYVGDGYYKYRSTSSYVGHGLGNRGELAFAALGKLKPYTRSYQSTSEVVKLFKEKKIAVAVISSSAEKQIKAKLPKLTVVVPGDMYNVANYQMLSIPKDSKNEDLSYKYIDYCLKKSVQKQTFELTNETPVRSGVIEKKGYNPNAVITIPDLPEQLPNFDSWQKQWKQIFE